MSSAMDVSSFINTRLRETLATLEGERQENLKKYRFARALAVVGGVIAMITGSVIILMMQSVECGACFIPPIAGGVIAIGGSRAARSKFFGKAFRARYKEEVISPLVNFFSPGARYSPEGFTSWLNFQDSGLFQPKPTVYTGDDHVVGRLGETNFEFSELNVMYLPAEAQSAARPLFKGLFLVADFPKSFAGYTAVIPRRKGTEVAVSTGNPMGDKRAAIFSSSVMVGPIWNPSESAYRPLTPFATGDSEFDSWFEVYTNDEVEAGYILNSRMRERLTGFQKQLAARTEARIAELREDTRVIRVINPDDMQRSDVSFSFLRNKFFVARGYNRPLFEFDFEKPFTDEEQLMLLGEDLSFVAGLVEDLCANDDVLNAELSESIPVGPVGMW